jgi:hypothetical protein
LRKKTKLVFFFQVFIKNIVHADKFNFPADFKKKNFGPVYIRWTGCQINFIKFLYWAFLVGNWMQKTVFPWSSWEGLAITEKLWRLRKNHRWYRETFFFAFNCQLKMLNSEILLSWFDIRFTEYKPECNFLEGSNLDRPKYFFPKISRKVKFLCLLILISRLSTHL